jgi:hypothetical protein
MSCHLDWKGAFAFGNVPHLDWEEAFPFGNVRHLDWREAFGNMLGVPSLVAEYSTQLGLHY